MYEVAIAVPTGAKKLSQQKITIQADVTKAATENEVEADTEPDVNAGVLENGDN